VIYDDNALLVNIELNVNIEFSVNIRARIRPLVRRAIVIAHNTLALNYERETLTTTNACDTTPLRLQAHVRY
jgi:hypothetical protein